MTIKITIHLQEHDMLRKSPENLHSTQTHFTSFSFICQILHRKINEYENSEKIKLLFAFIHVIKYVL